MKSTITRKRRPAREEPGDQTARFAAAVRKAAEAESDQRLRAWLLKLLDGDARERGK